MYENKVKVPEQNTEKALSESKQEAGGGVVARAPHHSFANIQRKANNTGLLDKLKSGIEQLSGHSMDDVKVHFNSSKPAQLHAHAYAQGTDIHVGPGQEKHLPHEAWHVVQQKQGRVRPTMQMKGRMNVNDEVGLEREADVMGGRALQMKRCGVSMESDPIDSLDSQEQTSSESSFQLMADNYFARQQQPIQMVKKKSLRKRIREKLNSGAGIESLKGRERNVKYLPKGKVDKSDLLQEIESRNNRRQDQNNEIAAEIREGNRPTKPSSLSQKEGGKDLTAHHLLPYNKLRDSFASILENQDNVGMQNILAFSGQKSSDSSEAYRALGFQSDIKPKKQIKRKLTKPEQEARKNQAIAEKKANIAFKRTLVSESSKKGKLGLFKDTAWASHNVFMGPAPEDRTDDPHEGLDTQFTPSGEITKSSKMAKKIHEQGFSGIPHVDFVTSLQSAKNEADGHSEIQKSGDSTVFGPRPKKGGLRNFKESSWEGSEVEGNLRYSQKGRREYQKNQRLIEDQHKRRTLNLWGR